MKNTRDEENIFGHASDRTKTDVQKDDTSGGNLRKRQKRKNANGTGARKENEQKRRRQAVEACAGDSLGENQQERKWFQGQERKKRTEKPNVGSYRIEQGKLDRGKVPGKG